MRDRKKALSRIVLCGVYTIISTPAHTEMHIAENLTIKYSKNHTCICMYVCIYVCMYACVYCIVLDASEIVFLTI